MGRLARRLEAGRAIVLAVARHVDHLALAVEIVALDEVGAVMDAGGDRGDARPHEAVDEAHAEAEGLGVAAAVQLREGQHDLGFSGPTPLHHGDGHAQRLQVLHRALHVRVAEGGGEALDLQCEFLLVDAGRCIERQHKFDGDRRGLGLRAGGEQHDEQSLRRNGA